MAGERAVMPARHHAVLAAAVLLLACCTASKKVVTPEDQVRVVRRAGKGRRVADRPISGSIAAAWAVARPADRTGAAAGGSGAAGAAARVAHGRD